jgi:FdhD protein
MIRGFPLQPSGPEYKMPGETGRARYPMAAPAEPLPPDPDPAAPAAAPEAARRMPAGRPSPSLPILPDPADPRLTRRVTGTDQGGAATEIAVVEERPLTIYLNAQEIVTAMTIGDYPDYLALGFLRNQGMLRPDDVVTGVDYDDEIETVVVRTERRTSYEEKVKKKTRTSGCAVGTVFGDMMEGLEGLRLPPAEVRTSWLYALAREINTTPSLYLEAGAIHGTVLCARDRPLVYMEDVGRHNAVDKIAGYMFRHGVGAADKILYTTGRLTSEMVIKCALMGIPVLASRSGFTAWGVEIARDVGLTLIGRMRGQRFVCLAGEERLIRDAAPAGEDEDRRHRRKGGEDD